MKDKRNVEFCSTSMEECIHSRRCFMTGEYCSKQTNIQKERKELHEEEFSINAFVIMNFSDMSDVVYKWRIKPFIESLAKFFCIDKENGRLYCAVSEADRIDELRKYHRVEKIHVVRSDSDPASNYVICSRICQQMQIADLIVVDVSNQNTNVFYEFGMAVANGKMILPICYSESFYKRILPQSLLERETEERRKNGSIDTIEHLEHHIGCYPWRKELFEYYGIRYKSLADDPKLDTGNWETGTGNGTRYIGFKEATKEENGFKDIQYDRFPYHECIESKRTEKASCGMNTEKDRSENGENREKRIGEKIYGRLERSYNSACYRNNTLVVYTMDGYLNREQAGQCIVNYYQYITKQMKEEQCFCGDRVGVLVQGNVIPESEKDADAPLNLYYNVAEIINIGVNQATYLALSEKIKTSDFLDVPLEMQDESPKVDKHDEALENQHDEDTGENETEKNQPDCMITKAQKKAIIRYVKEYVRNRGMLIYPDNPVYVNRVKNGIQANILGNDEDGDDVHFCLYHIMLKELRFVNEIVVDISKNNHQALFWLGAAHGSDTYSITVKHEETAVERELLTGSREGHDRNIFDVAGLWTAILHSNDTEGFYHQLSMAQIGIERHTKLMVKNTAFYEKSLREYLTSFVEKPDSDREIRSDNKDLRIDSIQMQKYLEEVRLLESYYRRSFWNRMLRYNRLRIYIPHSDDRNEKDNDPRLHIVKWDMDAIAAMSHYLSKRTVIGEYDFKSLESEQGDKGAESVNFICVGNGSCPLGKKLATYIDEKIDLTSNSYGDGYNKLFYQYERSFSCEKHENKEARIYKGFSENLKNGKGGMFTQLPCADCADCLLQKPGNAAEKIAHSTGSTAEQPCIEAENIEYQDCVLGQSNTHDQLAQLILWRDDANNASDTTYFRVAIIGSSGPATFGLSTLFVDRDQKIDLLGPLGKDEVRSPLCDLQAEIREKFLKVYLRELENKLNEENRIVFKSKNEAPADVCQINSKSKLDGKKDFVEKTKKKRYISLVKHAVAIYLSTVLYRYFLPFLSEQDIYSIYNSMKNFVLSMRATNVSPFALKYSAYGEYASTCVVTDESIHHVVEDVPELLLNLLQQFKGIEAFYKVSVEVISDSDGSSRKDTRKVTGIRTFKDNSKGNNTLDNSGVICLIGNNKNQSQCRNTECG